jgi:hypothetical protein
VSPDVDPDGKRMQERFAQRAGAPAEGGPRLVRPGRGGSPAVDAVAPARPAAPAASRAPEGGVQGGGPAPKRLSWYMRHADWVAMTRMRDELYHAAGAANPELRKQDAEGALVRAIAADFAAIKHRALADLLGRDPTATGE